MRKCAWEISGFGGSTTHGPRTAVCGNALSFPTLLGGPNHVLPEENMDRRALRVSEADK